LLYVKKIAEPLVVLHLRLVY